MTTHTRRVKTIGIPIVIMMALAALAPLFTGPSVAAQDGGDPPHPAHIHFGTCTELGEIAAPLADVALITEGDVQGGPGAVPVKESETEVELPLTDILAGQHAINIHLSADAITEYIACGEIGGRVVDGKVVIGLQEVNSSDHVGVAVLEEDDDETEVFVYLFEEGSTFGQEAAPAEGAGEAAATETPETEAPTAESAGEAAATEEPVADAPTAAAEPTEAPAAEAAPTVAPAAAAGAEIAIDIRDFAYNPDPIEISVGDSITWTNQDGVAHTATGQDRDVLQSGTIQPGESFTQTFDQAGEFPYFCEFHPNMTGTIIVS